jgi:Na+/H+ antiporter NhaD/arsenite permease-like protein
MIPGIIATIIFIGSLILIFSEKLDRTISAMVGAILMLGIGIKMGFYTEEQAAATIDFNTLGLLLGMMVLVALLEPTGFFQYLAIWAGKLSRGHPVRLLILLGSITTVLSMFLDNVTTVVLIAPVTILICEILGISATPLLMAEAILADTGGAATLVGDPPNILIASAANLSFNDFLTHSLPIVLVSWLVALFMLRYLFRTELAVKPKNLEAILELRPEEALEDPGTAKRVLVVLAIALIAFFLHEWMQLKPAFIGLSAAILGLVWIRPVIRETLKRIEWSVLIFFIALFVMVGGIEQTGVLHNISSLIFSLNQLNPILLGVIIIWSIAGLSAVVDNVPITIALIPVIQELGQAGVNITPLWWALVFGAGFGGNGTIIGSTANVVVVSISERTRTPITSRLWNRRGLPVMVATCLVASILYVFLFPHLLR